jgi:hypothetical protein
MSEHTMTAAEQRVLTEARSGELVDLGDLPEEDRVVSPDVIRRLCLGPEAQSVDPRGIRIRGARIVEPLDFSFCAVPHPLRFEATTFAAKPDLGGARIPAFWLVGCSSPGLTCSGLKVDRDFRLASSELHGEIQLRNARIGGDLDCSGATLRNEDGYALCADRAEIEGSMFLDKGFSATGEVRLVGIKIDGQLDCGRATLRNEGRNALSCERSEIRGSVFMNDGFSAAGDSRFLGAKIGGNLDCGGATLTSPGRHALWAAGAVIDGSVILRNGFTAIGELRLVGARIKGQLECKGATLRNEIGDALSADRAAINDVLFEAGFSATGRVRFVGARIGDDFSCRDAAFAAGGGADTIALTVSDATIGSSLGFRDVRVTGGVDLFRTATATLNDDLGDARDPLGSWSKVKPLVLDGFTYARFGPETEWDSKLRRRWLRHTTGFQQGAWQALIQVYRAQGRDDEATRAAIAMHNDRIRRAGLPWYRRAGRRLLWAVVGHGYRPWLAGAWATAIVAAFALVVSGWSGMFARKQGVTGSPQPVAYAADTFLPVVDLDQTDRWVPTGWMRWTEWIVILLGWSLTTIFVAGFTRIVRTE